MAPVMQYTFVFWLAAASAISSVAGVIPQYGASAGSKTAPARGWNSFPMQKNPDAQHEDSFNFDVKSLYKQCYYFKNNMQANFDYYCSLDSGWSVGDHGDDFGRIIPDTTVFNPDPIQTFASNLHANGLKLGIYVLPGAFESDKDKTVFGTNINIGSLFNNATSTTPGVNNSYNLRHDFDYTLDGVQQWHDSVVQLFKSWGVDMIKLDYVTPGSDLGLLPKDEKPPNDSPAVAMYRQAIRNNNADIRLDISWRLDMSDVNWNIWRPNADSLRLDRDITVDNTPLDFGPIQRTVEKYRQFINREVLRESNNNLPIMIRPDMDNLMVGNTGSSKGLSALSDTQRYTMAILWIGAGANLITGSNLLHTDHLGDMLLTNQEVMDVAAFTSNWPMVPHNPSDAVSPGQPGGTGPYQLQTWIAGPNEQGTAVVILSNLGEDRCTDNECSYATEWHGIHLVNITLDDLGIGGRKWFVRRVLGGGGQGGSDFTDIGPVDNFLASNLDHYESVMYKLQLCGTLGVSC